MTILNLHARFELRQIQEVTPVHRQVLDLTGRQNSLHGCLLGVDLNLTPLYFNHSALLANFQLHASVGRVVHFDIYGQLGRLEAFGLDAQRIDTRDQCSEGIRSRPVRDRVERLPRGARDCDFGVWQNRAG